LIFLLSQCKIKIRKNLIFSSMLDFRDTKKPKEFFYILKNRFRYFLQRTEKIFLREMKEQDIHDLWEYLGSFKIERNYKEEGKIFLYAVSIFFLATLIVSGNLIFTDHFRIYYKMSNAQAKEDSNLEIGENSGLNTSVETVNKYKMKSSEEICGESKNQKQSSGLCGKDDEEELQKVAKEEKIEQIRRAIVSRPRVVRISCREKDLGDPSRSDTKGKHMDEDCCPDPDEWPKPGCIYDAHGYSIMLKGPAKKK